MAYNNFDNKQSGGRNFNRRDFGGPSGFRQMHKAICSSCGRECEVPFKPSGEKPVFCSSCFEKNRGGSDTGRSDTRRFEDRSFNKPRFEDKSISQPQNNEQFNTLNTKLDKILAILTPLKPQVVEEVKLPVIAVEKKKRTSKKDILPPKV